ncbi:hypothetical protein [Acetobacter senegalensis]|uniref:hypothetical protein n=1 Tax=Acetobacter senegalensis TaxID=446692 RepID=UPI001ED9D50F|nr:hypothetical protein [Acetobacter senegalensis]MCG4256951.1 hypothetical protein [Acetobacter senegalensis]MCG4266911.1 hypothetical protein [Acetobacter senegalensis]
MRKTFFLAAYFAFAPVVSAAQTLPATKPPGGLDSTTVIPKVYADGTSGTLAQIGQMADGSVQQTEKGAANGVAGLNDSAELTSPVNTSGSIKSTGGGSISGGLSADTNIVSSHWRVVTDNHYVPNGAGRLEYPRVTDTDNVSDDAMLGGGHSDNDVFQLKFTGMNTSGGDEGGVVYEFDDRHGVQGNHRNGAGGLDGINVGASIEDNAPLDVIGGGAPSADGVTYAVAFPNAGEACITPGLSSLEKSYLRNRIRVWTNIANGMANTEGAGQSLDDGRYDLPNYYYGYDAGIAVDTAAETCLAIQTYHYPGTSATAAGFRSITSGVEPALPPGQNSGDSIDNKITGNTNYHSYTVPALFLGGNEKNFNLYTLEVFNHNPNALTRNYDNEFDHFITQDHDKEVVTRGVTYSWAASANHPFADGSYGIRVAGFNLMPVGLIVDGVYPNGGVAAAISGGFNIFRNLSELSTTQGAYITGSTLGFVGDTSGYNQLNYYSSMDGSATNGSVHLGLTHSASASLENNRDAGCANTGWITGDSSSLGCSFEGQLIYNPSGYDGGIALGAGKGASTKLSLVAKSDGTALAPVSFSSPSYQITLNGSVVGSIYGDQYGNMIFNKSNFVFLGSGSSFQVYGNASFKGSMAVPFGTPASSTAPCAQGQMEMDADYIYSCVAANSWHRASNGASW